ncbi:MAG TPA: GNAT family N-acetyltransferase [Caproiciproducens sp.]|nr:GNAT family N-acetyltransferase [Caproiciproducens sp.]
MDIRYDNTISEIDYNRLRKSVGWDEIPPQTAQVGLDNSEYIVAALCGGEPIGMARIISDGGYVRYIADVVIHPEYQGCGIGRAMINQIMEHIRNGKREGEKIMVCLMAAKGKEPFYKKCGLEERPNQGQGAGMSQWIE